MIITKAVPGQEEGNARLIVENGCGALCESDDAIVDAVANAAEDHAELWHRWHAAIVKLSKPDASREIARFILAQPASAVVSCVDGGCVRSPGG
jgi:UDP-N-acetylglucosamine:LPS N-acetylglucosamine transferase